MGWLRGIAPSKLQIRKPEDNAERRTESKQNVEHVEDTSSVSGDQCGTQQENILMPSKEYPFQTTEELPFIPSEIVVSKRRPGALSGMVSDAELRKDYWIVVDDVVYDCTDFVTQHPGGEQVILSFVGEDCSWQFWRFHGKHEMEQYAKGLRIGKTKGVMNRFVEPVRFVGLSKFGNDEW
jgi:hypothetical protein